MRTNALSSVHRTDPLFQQRRQISVFSQFHEQVYSPLSFIVHNKVSDQLNYVRRFATHITPLSAILLVFPSFSVCGHLLSRRLRVFQRLWRRRPVFFWCDKLWRRHHRHPFSDVRQYWSHGVWWHPYLSYTLHLVSDKSQWYLGGRRWSDPTLLTFWSFSSGGVMALMAFSVSSFVLLSTFLQ